MDQEALRHHVTSLLRAGKKIEAVRDYRAALGCGLADAKVGVEMIEAELRGGAPRGSETRAQGPELRARIEALLREKKPVDAIRVYRLATGCDLRAARHAVEAIGAELGSAPDAADTADTADTADAAVPTRTPRTNSNQATAVAPVPNRPRFAESDAPPAGRVPVLPLLVALLGTVAAAVALAYVLLAR